ncbi:MAG TPA: tRNA lysidine(34) synthetase TilS [Bacilli bacterium]|nr:tRNA lysidine(34) synthetase TilS [Bacilli bacterium]
MNCSLNPNLLDKNKRYVVAVSFGPDSMALLNLLYEGGYQVIVAHVNYHKRAQSNLEQTGLEQYCLNRDIPIYVLDVDATAAEGNFQGWARTIRYRFFADIVNEENATAILTAHHLNDHIETILLQKKRKTMSFCMGICLKTTILGQQVIRPLLHVSKDELIDYCTSRHIDYAIDESNMTDAYERNRIRHHLVPKLETHEIEKLLLEAETYNANTEKLLHEIAQSFIEGKLLIKQVFGYGDREIFLALHLLLEKQCHDYPISKTLLKEVRDIAHGTKSHWRRHLRGDVWLVRSYDTLEVMKFDRTDKYSYTYSKPSKDDTPYFYMDFTQSSHRGVAPIESYPITIRNPEPGDYLLIEGHRRLLRRLFIDWKLPRHRRHSWPVMLDRHGEIIFVPRYRPEFKIEDNPRFFVK